MALSLRLSSSAGIVCDLTDGTNYDVLPGSMLGARQTSRIWGQTWGQDYTALAGVSEQMRQAAFIIQVKGSSLDNFTQNVHNLMYLLDEAQEFWAPKDGGTIGRSGARAYLTWQLAGMTNGTEYDVLGGSFDPSRLEHTLTRTSAPQLNGVPLTLFLRPFGRPQVLTKVTSGTLNNGGTASDTYTLPSVSGDVRSPVRVTFQSAAGDDYRRIILGKKSKGRVANVPWGIEAEGGSGLSTAWEVTASAIGGATFANVANTSARGGNVLRLTQSTAGAPASAEIQVTLKSNIADLYGDYRVFLRIENQPVANTITGVRLDYGGASGDSRVGVANTATAAFGSTGGKHLVEVGRMSIPYPDAPQGAQTDFRFTVSVGLVSTTAVPLTVDLDAIFLLPVDEEVADIELSGSATAQDQIVMDHIGSPEPSIYKLNSSGEISYQTLQPNMAGRFWLPPQTPSRWFGLMLNSTLLGHDLTDQFTLAFEYFPQYSQQR